MITSHYNATHIFIHYFTLLFTFAHTTHVQVDLIKLTTEMLKTAMELQSKATMNSNNVDRTCHENYYCIWDKHRFPAGIDPNR